MEKPNIKLFINNFILLCLFIYTFSLTSSAYAYLEIQKLKEQQYIQAQSETIYINYSDIMKEYGIEQTQTINKYKYPKKLLVILLSIELILILNQYFYLNQYYITPYLRNHINKKKKIDRV